MAKKKSGKFEFSKIGSLIDDIAKKTPIFIEKEDKKVERISTGIYILNACMSGSIYGGIKGDAITVFAGPEASGKTFIALNAAREAQRNGYGIIYIDTENSINKGELYKYGIDKSKDKFILLKTNKVEDINITLSQLLDELKQRKLDGEEIGKSMIILDSLAQLASNKEKEDLISGKLKQDMTKAKAIGSFFRSITIDLGYLNIPMIVNNQTYQCVIGETEVMMSDGGFKMIKDIIKGDSVMTLEGEKEVNFTKKFEKASIVKLTLENGQEIECTHDHKFLIKKEWSEDESDSCWINASELKEEDVILKIN
jgi:RecA/RadA recombinase